MIKWIYCWSDDIDMTDIKTIILGVISSGLFAVIVYILNKLKIIEPFAYHKAKKRIVSAGIVTFYSKRSTFTKDAGTIGCYVSKAKKEVNYIGFWLSNGLQHQDLIEKIVEQINKGVKFNFCVISPNSPLIDYYADFFGEDKESVVAQINTCINTLKNLRKNLQYDKQQHLRILLHEKIVTTTFWVIDPEENKSMIQLDHKIYNLPRHYTYGFQIKKKRSNQSFYVNLVKAYLEIMSSAEDISM